MTSPAKLRALWRFRPRVLTLLLLLVIAAPITLANFTSEIQSVPGRRELGETHANPRGAYGWPFLWHWHDIVETIVPDLIVGWGYSRGWLTANLASWAIMLAVPAVACEWLLRRYRPRFRWSLRTMLAAVAAVAVCCGWFTAARHRANLQDPIIAELGRDPQWPQFVGVERPGPKWLEFVVPDRFRRRVVAVDATLYGYTVDEALVARLGQLSRLKYLNLAVERFTPRMAAALRNLRQLRWLQLEEKKPSRDSLAAIGTLTQLEGLRLHSRKLTSNGLSCLAGLTNLKTFTVKSYYEGAFSQMPALPQLEAIRVVNSPVGPEDLQRLAVLPSLKALDLRNADFAGDAKLADLANLASLEDLAVDNDMVSAEDLKSLTALRRLRYLYFSSAFLKEDKDESRLKLADGKELVVSEREVDGFRRAFDSLRQSHPGIVIDSDSTTIDARFERQGPPLYAIYHRHYGLYGPESPWKHIETPFFHSTWLPAQLEWAPASFIRQLGGK